MNVNEEKNTHDDRASGAGEAPDSELTLLPCPFCGARPDPPYTNSVGESYARIKHDASCMFRPREQWINSLAFKDWNTRNVPAR